MIQGDLKISDYDPKVKWKWTKDGTHTEQRTTTIFSGKVKVGGEEIELDAKLTLTFDAIHTDAIKSALRWNSEKPIIELTVRPSKQTSLSLDFAANVPLKTKKVPKGQKRFDDLPQKANHLDFLPPEERPEGD